MRADVRVRLAALVVLVIIAVALAVFLGVPNLTQVRHQYAGTGPLGALGFAAVYALFSLLPLPAEVFTIAAGVVFGLGRGLPIVVLGASSGALGGFWLGRVLGRDAVAHLTGTRAQTLDAFLTSRGFWAVLTARLIPLVPFTALNYLSGLTTVPARSYLAATVLGILPASTAYVALGAYGQRPGSWPFLAALGALLLLSGAGVGAAAIRRSRIRRTERTPARGLTGPGR